MTATVRMEIDRDLTLLYRAEFQEQLSTTYEGQAHFVSTGPLAMPRLHLLGRRAGPNPQPSLPEIHRHDRRHVETGAGVRAVPPPI